MPRDNWKDLVERSKASGKKKEAKKTVRQKGRAEHERRWKKKIEGRKKRGII